MIFFKSAVMVMVMVACLGSLAIAGEAQPIGSFAVANDAQPRAVLGWNFVNAKFCYFDSAGLWFFGNDGNVWFTSNTGTQNLLTPSCSTGTLVAFHVPSAGVFDATIAYPFK